ncbi:hypothetical protein J2T12_001748 [Paenibacillus anaericanus]|uniref:Uncharacterized protein n=1 Tax=Paenibacillus anaericanus TaxID=170367 RepID=A0A3S1DMG4_9BACL|nr:hypothetical protein [Paenibacillus anaericanus]MDQ0088342.1 hypothetical protein [Paenibacillus anaericanus]RUT47876.1 hypothetical protein EJP82_05720 [Paenibacillus anaericanus]
MNKSYEVEYCNLELRFDRRHIQQLIRDLIQDGYSLYWSENENIFIISVRTGRKLTKLRFQRLAKGYKLVGDYVIKDAKLADWLEKQIGDLRGHAVVKRFKDRQVLIESILFGEVIRLVEIIGVEHRVIFQKGPMVDRRKLAEIFASEAAECQLKSLEQELDDELAKLSAALQCGDEEAVEACKEKLRNLRIELIRLEW